MTTSAGTLALSVSYDAANQSYTVNDGTRSQTFLPVSRDAAQSNAQVTTYRVTSGNTTDTLSLTTTGTASGQTHYVAAGFWQRQVTGATAVDGRFEAFAYGIRTPDGSLPRTGVASFDVTLLGAETFEKLVYALGGTGRINADLQSGAIVGAGSYSRTNVQTNAREDGFVWGLAAFLSANSNAFAGRIGLTSIGGGGEVHGSFFGPAGQEVGASFSANPNSGVAAVGAIVGARNTTRQVNQVTSLANPENDVFYRPLGVAARGTLDAAGKLSAIGAAPALLTIYNATGNAAPPKFFSIDGRELGTSVPPGQEQFLRVLASSNVAFGLTFDKRPTLGLLDAFVYGFDTTAASLPRTGSGAFNVSLQGGVLMPGSGLQSLDGRGVLSVNFASGAIATAGGYGVTSAVPVQQAHTSGTVTDSGTWTGSATLSATANAFGGTLTLDGATDYTGTLTGKFFGAGASEVGAVADLSAAGGARAIAAIVGLRGTGVSALPVALRDLAAPLTLHGSTAQFDTIPVFTPATFSGTYGPVEITYDPVAKSYVFRATRTAAFGSAVKLERTLTEAQRNPAASNATFTAYQAPNMTARVFNHGSGNPQIVLSYTSFAEITETVVQGGVSTTAQHFVPFGVQTPNFQMPRSGTASYSGVVYGAGRHGTVAPRAGLTGTSQLAVNFGTNVASLAMTLTATNLDTSATTALGSFTYGGAIGGSCPGGCDTNTFVLFNTTAGGSSGAADGRFYGPEAAEFGAAFTLNLPATTAGNAATSSTFAGVTVGKKN
ncbi:MAG TPA: hypothetical protein VI168_03730 [Croceibacterium sp.]